MRDLDAQLLTALAGGELRLFNLLWFQLAGTDYRYTDCDVPIAAPWDVELVTNGDMELDSDWTDSGSPTTNERSNVQARAGTYSRKFTVDAAEEGIQGATFTTVTGERHRLELWVYPDDTTTVRLEFRRGDGGGDLLAENVTGLTQDSWNKITRYVDETNGGSSARIRVESPTGQSSGSWYVDDVSVRRMDLYEPMAVTIPNIRATMKDIVDTAKIDLDNVGDIFTGAFVGGTPYGEPLKTYMVILDSNYKPISSPINSFDGEIDAWSLDEEAVKIKAVNDLAKWKRTTLSLHSPSCRWRVFKGAECQYAGGESWCDRTYTRCVALGNTAENGGFRWLSSIEDQTIWWGPIPTHKYGTDPDQKGAVAVKGTYMTTKKVLPLVYGLRRVGGNVVYVGTSGTNKEILWLVITLSEGQCNQIKQVDGNDQVWLDGRPIAEFGANAVHYFHNGSPTQTYDTNLNGALPEWTDNLRNTCYLLLKLTYDRDLFNRAPSVEVLLEGIRIYDPRDQTTKYDPNAALADYDYFTSQRYGMGIDTAKIDEDSWGDVADYCDTKSWELNHYAEKTGGQGMLETMQKHFRGSRIWSDGKWYLRRADLPLESSVMTLTDEHIVQKRDGKFDIQIREQSVLDRPDAIQIKWVDPYQDYSDDTIPIGDQLGNMVTYDLPGCTIRQQASDLGVSQLERRQLNRTIPGTFRLDVLKLEPHDIITANFDHLGISDQEMRVIELEAKDNAVKLELLYEDDSLYDQVYNLVSAQVYECDIPSKDDPPPSVGNVQLSETLVDFRLRSFTRLNVSFDPPSGYPWFSHVEIWRSFDDAGYEFWGKADSDFSIDNVEEGTTWWLILIAVSIYDVKQTLATGYKASRLIQGQNSTPSSLAGISAIANDNTVNIYGVKLSDADIEVYEFRLAGWSGGIFLASLRSPNLSLQGVKPGDHTFYANTLSNNGFYGDTPRSAATSLIEPPKGWTVQATETCNYNGIGTHSNTEHTIYNSEDHLKCSHSGGVLTGTYTSPEYDRGASGTYLVYVLADIVVIGVGTTWGDVIPSPDTWADINITTRTWQEIFELEEAPAVNIKLMWGDVSGSLTNSAEKMEILSTIATGRYFQVEITITDPSDAVNALVEEFSLKFCQ